MTTTEDRPTTTVAPPRHRADRGLDPQDADDRTELLPALDLDATAVTPAVRGARTVTPVATDRPAGPRRRTGGRPPGDRGNLALAAVAGIAIGALLFGTVAPLSGRLGFTVVSWVAFLLVYGALTAVDSSGQMVKDRLMTVALGSLAAVLFGALVTVVVFVLGRGVNAMVHLNFYMQDQSVTGPLDPLTVGGILHAVIGTLIMMTICLGITVPLGISCAVFLAVVKGPGSRFVRTIVEAMTALPSIVAGLFVLATWILLLGNERSGIAASLALSVMMLPIIIRAADVVLRLVPNTLIEASEALGAPRWRTVLTVVLPTSKSGLATAVILGTARGIGETSPVLLTAGFTQSINVNPFSGPMVSLPLAAFQFTRSPQPALVERGFGTAGVLLVLVLVLFLLARVIGGRGPGQLSPRQRQRAVRQSHADARRFDRAEQPLSPAPVAPPTPSPTGSL